MESLLPSLDSFKHSTERGLCLSLASEQLGNPARMKVGATAAWARRQPPERHRVPKPGESVPRESNRPANRGCDATCRSRARRKKIPSRRETGLGAQARPQSQPGDGQDYGRWFPTRGQPERRVGWVFPRHDGTWGKGTRGVPPNRPLTGYSRARSLLIFQSSNRPNLS